MGSGGPVRKIKEQAPGCRSPGCAAANHRESKLRRGDREGHFLVVAFSASSPRDEGVRVSPIHHRA